MIWYEKLKTFDFNHVKNIAKKYGKNKIPEPFNGVDRIDSSLGYSVNNCLPCCEKCNKMKLVYETNDFLNHIKQIYEFNNLNLRFND